MAIMRLLFPSLAGKNLYNNEHVAIKLVSSQGAVEGSIKEPAHKSQREIGVGIYDTEREEREIGVGIYDTEREERDRGGNI